MFGMYIPGYIRDKHIGGVHVVDDPEPDGPTEWESLMCAHCNCHYDREYGVLPRVCSTCKDIVCNEPRCYICVPFEAKMEAMEGSRRFWKQLELDTTELR